MPLIFGISFNSDKVRLKVKLPYESMVTFPSFNSDKVRLKESDCSVIASREISFNSDKVRLKVQSVIL